MRNTLCTLIPILESENNELYLKSILQMSFVSVEFDFNVEKCAGFEKWETHKLLSDY